MKTLPLLLIAACGVWAEELQLVTGVEFQPLAAQVARVVQVLELTGAPLSSADAAEVKKLLASPGGKEQAAAIQKVLDKYAITGIEINPESRVKAQQGAAPARLMEQGWRTFLVKVANQAGITAVLAVDSPNSGQLANSSGGAVNRRWIDPAKFMRRAVRTPSGRRRAAIREI